MSRERNSVRKLLITLLPSELASLLIVNLGEGRSLGIARRLRGMANPAHREKYALNAIRNQKQIAADEEWLKSHPDYEELVDEDELRELPIEIRLRHRQRREREERIAALRGERSGFDMLVMAKGRDRAVTLYRKVTDALLLLSPATRINAILRGASAARDPDAYVATAIRNERARMVEQKNAVGSNP